MYYNAYKYHTYIIHKTELINAYLGPKCMEFKICIAPMKAEVNRIRVTAYANITYLPQHKMNLFTIFNFHRNTYTDYA